MIEEKSGGHKLIFEGVELAGKSSVIHHVYNYLEEKYNTQRHILDGCHWFNSDIGIFGTEHGREIVEKYVEMAEILRDKNVIFEKLHISDEVYQELNLNNPLEYNQIENRLLKLDAKIILCVVRESEEIFSKRLKDRLTSHTHYGRISRNPKDYLEIQKKYMEKARKTGLPVLEVDLTELPNPEAVKKILNWIGEDSG